jgi:hypothetical protein
MQIADARLQHDLYDRRYRIFDAARRLLSEIIIHGNATDEALRAFVLGTSDALFLLDDDLAKYLAEMSQHARALVAIKIAMEALPVGEQKANASKVAIDHQMWLVEQLDDLADKFRPVLRLNKRQRARWRWFN